MGFRALSILTMRGVLPVSALVLRRVVTPCHSIACPGRTMEGTRLTIQYKHPNGYEYTIRTPGTPSR